MLIAATTGPDAFAQKRGLGHLLDDVAPIQLPRKRDIEMPSTSRYIEAPNSTMRGASSINPRTDALLKNLHEIETEPRLRLSTAGEPTIRASRSSSSLSLDEYSALHAAVPHWDRPSILVDREDLYHPIELKGIIDKGYSLHVRDVLEKKSVRVEKDRNGDLEVLIDLRPNLSVSNDVFINRSSLSQVSARDMVENMRVVLLADGRDVAQIAEFKSVVGSSLFVPKSADELFEYIRLNPREFYVVVGHSEGAAFHVNNTSGSMLFKVDFDKLGTQVHASDSALLNLSCSAACNASISGATAQLTSRDVVDMLRHRKDKDLLSLLDDLGSQSGTPMVVRRDLLHGATLLAEPDRTKLVRPGPINSVHFETKTHSASSLVPLLLKTESISQTKEGSHEGHLVGTIFVTIILVCFSPFIIWGGAALLMLLAFQNPFGLMELARVLAGRTSWEDHDEESKSFLTSTIGVFIVGSYALVWTALIFFNAWFGAIAILFLAFPGVLLVVGFALVFGLLDSTHPRLYFTGKASLGELAVNTGFRAFAWFVPGCLMFTGFATMDKYSKYGLGMSDINFVFPRNEEIAWLGVYIAIALGLAEFLRRIRWKRPDLVTLTIAIGTLPWSAMRSFDRLLELRTR
ncbi:hypothetical protein ML401_20285 [Bradyrhizobium sp. 62B]|uniref:hypothetical protein n=1 Tax=Bradyrhizobium sp. 62B TaxID=2898442 RepID=UPI0025580C5E|nr:hypothetical protein ML401_20285 [Bradyrhizobium sp. 62B]